MVDVVLGDYVSLKNSNSRKGRIRNETHKKIILLMIAICLLALTFFTYRYLDAQNKEYIINIENADMFFDITDGFVYFGRDTCPSCELFLPLLMEVAKDENKQVYYFNTGYFRVNNLLIRRRITTDFR